MAFRFAICENGSSLDSALGRRAADRDTDSSLCCFSCFAALQQAVEAGARFDIVLFDLRQEDGGGIAHMLELFPAASGTQIIFVAAPDVHASVPAQGHIRFLDRPLRAGALVDVLQQALAALREQQPAVPIRSGSRTLRLPTARIAYIACRKGRLQIHTTDGGIVETQTSLGSLCGKLGETFLTCHRSYVVNLEQVTALNPDAFILAGGAHIPVSRRRYAEMCRAYAAFMGKKSPVPGRRTSPWAGGSMVNFEKALDLE